MSSGAKRPSADIEEVVKLFESIWRRGDQPVISDFCDGSDPGADGLLEALVLIDLEHRLKSGQTRTADDYLREFPRLQSRRDTVFRLLQLEERWKIGEPRASIGDTAEAQKKRFPDDVGAAVETAASGADLSVIAPTRTSPGDGFSSPDLSGETVSTEEPPSLTRLPVPRMLGKFQLIEVVGQGGFGTVYRGKDTELDRDVAVKFPKKDMLGSDQERERFIREARSAAALRHPNIVPIYEVGGTRERPFIVSAFVEGSTLSKALAQRKFGPREAAQNVRVIANALHYAHDAGIIHRDVKPANIMLDERGEPFLMDFGLARRAGEAVITRDGAILGTPAYMSPEQAQGHAVDARTDVYSVGVVLYELLTRERPFQGNVHSVLHQVVNTPPRSPKLTAPDLPADLEQICLKCIEKAPVDRYATAQELEHDLLRFLQGLPVAARPISRVAKSWRWARRHPKTAILIVFSAALAVTLPIVREVYTNEVAKERNSARLAEEANRKRLAQLFVSKGNERIEAGNPLLALPWFAAVMEQLSLGAPVGYEHRVRLVTAIGGQSVERTWRLSGNIFSVARCSSRPLLAIATPPEGVTILNLEAHADVGRILPHPAQVTQCTFSADGTRLATTCNDCFVRVWMISALQTKPMLLEHENLISWTSFDPSGRLLAVATGSSVRLWDASSGKPLQPLLAHRENVVHLAFSPDSSLLATASGDRAAHLWSTNERKEIAPALAHNGSVNCVCFAPDGGTLFSGSEDGTIRAWDTKRYSQQFALQLGSPVLCLAVSADGTFIAGGCQDGRVGVWNLKSRTPLAGEFSHERSVRVLSFSRTHPTLVAGSDDGVVRIWDLTNGLATAPPLPGGRVIWAELGEDRKHLLTAGLDGILREWSLGKPFKAEHRCTDIGSLASARISTNGRWLLLRGDRGPIHLCDLSDHKLVFVPLANSSAARQASFAVDANHLVLARGNGDLDLWNIAARAKPLRVQGCTGPLNDVGLSPDCQTAVTANTDGYARVVSFARASITLTLPHGAGLKRALYSKDGEKIYTAGGQRGLCLWNSNSGKLLSEFHYPGGEIQEIVDCQLSPDGRFLLAFPASASAAVCDASTGALVGKIPPHANVAFSDDSTRLVAIYKQAAGTWDLKTGKQVATPTSQRGDVSCCAIRGDGSLFATGGADKTARVWNADTGEAVSPPLKHSDRVVFVAFREAGNQLVTVSADAVIRLWTLDDGTPTERLIHLARATSGQKIDDNGMAVTLKPKEIEAEWNAAHGAPSADSQ